MNVEVMPIGWVRGGRTLAEDDHWGATRCQLELDATRFSPESLAGLAEFSHAEVVFLFDRVAQADIVSGARHPRGRKDWPCVGIFAQRAKDRPNRIGVSTCRIIGVAGTSVDVEGLDAIDGTPVLDIKPVMREFLPRGAIRQPAWASDLMKAYW